MYGRERRAGIWRAERVVLVCVGAWVRRRWHSEREGTKKEPAQ